ncbi:MULTISPECIES: hypothetical protein [Pseudomonas]|jgi:hypothetical protein|uniref:Lipoprotein n=1 Tax=Pseudomonas peradeniyensis TaxID=2745488 RepID=A0ABT2VA57_9PSED|nr:MULTISPECIES: hypothetical protein [Pseudomonas]MBI6898887.1 hypothetical protein [Pseudomonas putida]MDC0688088.1 hypothetical protein [Mitsuaria sp. RG]KNX76020.1 hypothetical protein DA83_09500 [Pseudomonas sp. 250J]MBC3433857.1 hypothetical protein [Pseudomonas sp. BW16M2]MCE0913259.1 hypothetical protein [Pseudomonas sp. NMI760_13]
MSPLIRAAALGLALTGLAGCTSKPVLNPAEQLTAGHNYSQAQVQQAILKAVAERGWTARNVGASVIQADITVRNTFFAAVDIHYSPSQFRIAYRDSRELGYKDGQIHRNYNRWVYNLDRSILRELNALNTQRILQQQGNASVSN